MTLFPCRNLVVLLLFSYLSSQVLANNTYRRFVLKHRDAVELQAVITPLLPADSAVSVDNNDLLVSAPSSDMKGIAKLIKRADKPRKLLKVSVYRGKYPDKQNTVIASTDTGLNTLQSIYTEEGAMVAITKKDIVKINLKKNPVIAYPYSPRHLDLADKEVSHTALVDNQRSQLLPRSSGIYLRTYLINKKQARINATIVTPDDIAPATGELGNQAISLSNHIETISQLQLNQWAKLTEQQMFTHRPKLNSQRKVYSTETADDDEHSVWVKVEIKKKTSR